MVNQGGFVAYYRVSTGKQGKSGLGLEAQRAAVAQLPQWRRLAHHCRVHRSRERQALRPARIGQGVAAARLHRVPLVVSKVDRLTRSVAFLSRLLEAGVDVRFADLPQIEGATGRFLLQQMVAVAELEAGMISARTKAALAAAKRRGVQLGGDRGGRLSVKARKAGNKANAQAADARAADVAPVIAELQASGAESLRAIAAGLNARGIPTARGHGQWSAVQVARVIGRQAGAAH